VAELSVDLWASWELFRLAGTDELGLLAGWLNWSVWELGRLGTATGTGGGTALNCCTL